MYIWSVTQYGAMHVFFIKWFLRRFLCIYLHFHYSFLNSTCIRKQMSENPTVAVVTPSTNSHTGGGATLSTQP